MALAIINTVSAGFMFAVWSKRDPINFTIKLAFLALLIANVVALVKV